MMSTGSDFAKRLLNFVSSHIDDVISSIRMERSFDIRDQMVSYYGFERYEVNNSSSPTRWRFAESDVVDGGFSLTGSSHLRFASCWIRPSDGVHSLASTIETHQITNCFKAIVSANETEVVGLLGRIMRKTGDWLSICH